MLINFIGVLFDGIAYGSLLFLISVGLSVTMGLMNFINLAHGAFAMAGGYITVLLMQHFGVPFLLCLPLAFVGAHTSIVLISLVLAIRGLSIGFSFMPAMTAAFAALRPEQLSDATPQMNTLQRLGVIKSTFDVNKHIEAKHIVNVMAKQPELFSDLPPVPAEVAVKPGYQFKP